MDQLRHSIKGKILNTRIVFKFLVEKQYGISDRRQ